MNKLLTCLIALTAVFCVSCTREKPRYIIGVSQCSQDIWRDKLNSELKMGTYFQ